LFFALPNALFPLKSTPRQWQHLGGKTYKSYICGIEKTSSTWLSQMLKKWFYLSAGISFITLTLASASQSIQASNISVSAVKSLPESNLSKQTLTTSSINVAAGKLVIARAGGVTYPGWANANDLVDYKKTTSYPQLGRWGHQTNTGNGTFQVVDLGTVYLLNGFGYNIDWDGAYKNPLTFRVEVSTDNKTWRLASHIVHNYSATIGSNKLDIDVTTRPMFARYVKYSEPPDGQWNGWGTIFQLRAYSPKK
jgi:hypothetical protein